MSEEKQEHLRRLSGSNGVIGALAMDQRKSLRRLIATAAGGSLDQIPDSDLAAFKTAVSEVLSPYATAILLDTEYGLGAAGRRHPSCGLLLAYESDGYENPRPHRMPALMPDLSVRRLMESGADGVKLLLHFSPDDPHGANTQKFAMVERIGSECAAVGLPFFLEPLLYESSQSLVQTGLSPQQRQEQAFAFARRKPQLVVDLMREFSRERYGVDILKVEFPVVAAFVEGSATFGGRAAYSMDEALQWYRRADEAAGKPYIYLSAGVSSAEFLESLRLANAAGALSIPVVRIDRAMADTAVNSGTRIAVLATLATTLDPTERLIQRRAAAMNKPVVTTRFLADSAFDALLRGEAARHDEILKSELERATKSNDVVVLAQGSMARLIDGMSAGGVPVLSSPRSGVESLREALRQ